MTKNEKRIAELQTALAMITSCELDSRFKMRACLVTLASLIARIITELERESR